MRRTYTLALLLAMILTACNLSATPQTGDDARLTDAGGRLTVVWVEDGSLMAWRHGDDAARRIASGGVIRPYLAPDGGHVLFARGPLGVAESLWVADMDGAAEQELVTRDDLPSIGGGQPMIGDIAWFDESVFYFNTLQRFEAGRQTSDDLYRANIRTREVALIRRPTEGGQFAISPDRQHIALVVPGTYNRQDGVIRLIDPLGQEATNLLFYVGVSTASEYDFYPPLYWRSDSSALLVPIPDADLVYGAVDTPPADLWSLPVEIPQDRTVIGSVPASFFGLPRWSESGAYMVYMRQVGDISNNRYELVLANGRGENAVGYASGNAGTLEPAQWIPGAERFFFSQGESGVFWLGAPDMSPKRIPNADETMFTPLFVNDTLVVFATMAAEGEVALHYASLDHIGQPSTRIASVGDSLPSFDALIAP